MRVTLLAALLLLPLTHAADSWPQWGGPGRDFVVPGRELSQDWGEEGPREIWARPLGGGFASIVSDGKHLYTSYRDGDEEVVISLDPDGGKTRWEHRYPAPVPDTPALSKEYGTGPNGTPLLIDGQVITLGFTGKLRCLDAGSGELRWGHDLLKDHEVAIPYFGHAASPLAVGDHVVIVAGGLFAFDRKSGKVAWSNRDFDGNYGSPILVGKGSKQQIVTPVLAHIAGFDPATGKTLWTVEHKNQWGTILTTPIADDEGRVFISAYGIGSLLVDPNAKSDEARTVWSARKTTVNHNNSVRRGDWLFASSGDTASFVSATSLKDGKLAWKERGFGQANLLSVGDDLLLLDFDGELALLEADGKGMKVATRATINDQPTWTPPTLLGTTLYFRDESRIVALDLSK